MSTRVDPRTLVCREHNVEACVVCMVDEYHDHLDRRAASRERRRLQHYPTSRAKA